MKYRDMLGFPKKKAKKKVIPEQPKHSVADKLKEEFGLLNEWSEVDTGPKRWFKPMDEEGLTKFEKSQMKEEVLNEEIIEVERIHDIESSIFDIIIEFKKTFEKSEWKKNRKKNSLIKQMINLEA